jgi:uncharacterized phage-associated protein
MTTGADVADLIRARMPKGLDSLKLQKLLFYTQAWSLAWRGVPLFGDTIEAWIHGPIVRAVYENVPGNAAKVEHEGVAVVDAVLVAYGSHSGAWLRDLTHREAPWRNARKGLTAEQRSSRVISHEELRSYYKPSKMFGFDDAYLRGLELLVETPEDELADLLSSDSVPAADFLAFLESGDECESSR